MESTLFCVTTEDELQKDLIAPSGFDDWPTEEKLSRSAAFRQAWHKCKAKVLTDEKRNEAAISSSNVEEIQPEVRPLRQEFAQTPRLRRAPPPRSQNAPPPRSQSDAHTTKMVDGECTPSHVHCRMDWKCRLYHTPEEQSLIHPISALGGGPPTILRVRGQHVNNPTVTPMRKRKAGQCQNNEQGDPSVNAATSKAAKFNQSNLHYPCLRREALGAGS